MSASPPAAIAGYWASFYLFLRSKYGLVSEVELFPPTAGPTPTKLKLFCTFHLMDGSWMTREGT